MRVYLAGGLKTDWQDDFVNEFSMVFDPRTLSGSLKEIAEQGEKWLKECYAVLAYAEDSNPRPIGLAYELGYAKALGKPTVLLVDVIDPRTHWLQYMVDLCTTDRNKAVEFIRTTIGMYSPVDPMIN